MAARMGLLEVDVTDERVDELEDAATFGSMQANGDTLAPEPAAALTDKSRFLRSGRSGAGSDILDPDALSAYLARASRAAPTDVLTWFHRGSLRANHGLARHR